MTDTPPENPLPPLTAELALFYEYYKSAVDAGFSPDQAMQIVLLMLRVNLEKSR